MGIIEKISDYIKDTVDKKGRKKLIENLAIITIIGIIAIIAGNTLLSVNKAGRESTVSGSVNTVNTVKTESVGIFSNEEEKIARILSKIEGAGRVDVVITYEASKEIVPAYETKRNSSMTEEEDSEGGIRNIEEENTEEKLAYQDEEGGLKKPVIIKELQPVIKGVVVVAEGADNAEVREDLTRAAQILTGVPIHKIQVFKRDK